MIATLTLSLGATNRGPPSTCLGTMVKAAAAAAVVAMNSRRVVVGLASMSVLLMDEVSSTHHTTPRGQRATEAPAASVLPDAKPLRTQPCRQLRLHEFRNRERQARESFDQVEAQPHAEIADEAARLRPGPMPGEPLLGREARHAHIETPGGHAGIP